LTLNYASAPQSRPPHTSNAGHNALQHEQHSHKPERTAYAYATHPS